MFCFVGQFGDFGIYRFCAFFKSFRWHLTVELFRYSLRLHKYGSEMAHCVQNGIEIKSAVKFCFFIDY